MWVRLPFSSAIRCRAVSDIISDFDEWMVSSFDATGPFTMLLVAVTIGESSVTPLNSAYLHVMGNEMRWCDMLKILAGESFDWDAVAFFRAGREGLVEDHEAKRRLASLMRNIYEDRSLIRHSDFFDSDGLRLALQEVKH